jgi:hypothetical protein
MIRSSSGYRPKKHKRQRRQRGKAKQKSRMSYRSNPGLHRLMSRLRYQHFYKRNPRYKRKRNIRRKNPARFRRLGGDPHGPHLSGMWFMLPKGDDFQVGHIHKVWGADWTIEYELEDGGSGDMPVDEFMETAIMEDESDIAALHDILEQASGIRTDREDDVVWEFDGEREADEASFEKMTDRVAGRHLAFNKENPSELLNQMVRVLSKASDRAEGKGKRGLEAALTDVRGLTKAVQGAWSGRNEE